MADRDGRQGLPALDRQRVSALGRRATELFLSDTLSGLLNESAKGVGCLIESLKTAAKDNAMVRVICGNCGTVLLLDHRKMLGEEATTDE